MGLYCGIDLSSNHHVMTVIDEGDRRLYERRLPNDLAITKAAPSCSPGGGPSSPGWKMNTIVPGS